MVDTILYNTKYNKTVSNGHTTRIENYSLSRD